MFCAIRGNSQDPACQVRRCDDDADVAEMGAEGAAASPDLCTCLSCGTQLCSQCTDDSQAVFQSCANSCASAALGSQGFSAAGTPAAQAYVFLAFLASEVRGRGVWGSGL